jgi:hypothetical protein
MKKKRDLRQLVQLIAENGDQELRFVGHLDDDEKCRVWHGLKSGVYYLEYKDRCITVITGQDKNVLHNTVISFWRLKSMLEWEPERLRWLVRFELETSLTELMLKDEKCILRFGGYFEGFNLRLWFPKGSKQVYIETPIGAYKEDDPKELYEV